jgi:hypothetical protein
MGGPASHGALRLCLALAVLAALAIPPATQAGTLRQPIARWQQTSLAFGDRSHWLQPWRAYLDTPPASRLRDAIGINFDNGIVQEEVAATARLLGRSGFRRARIEFGWDQMDYSDPRRLRNPAFIRSRLEALRANRIRPLILLNANHGGPGPRRSFNAVLAEPAHAGARRVRLDAATAHAVVPNRTGLDEVEPGRADAVLFTSVDGLGWATLSRPLPRNLPAGPQPASTLRYGPFGPPLLSNGRRNPAFEDTLGGWLAYVGAVTREARALFGPRGFDVEIWNEMTFGSDYLFQERYYDPVRERGQGDVVEALLARTVVYLRDPRSGVSGIGISSGFANQSPFPAGSTSPRGLTALSKHPYKDMQHFPRDTRVDGVSPLDALGRTDFSERGAPSGGVLRKDRFMPRYDAWFPEYFLSAIQTESMIRDLSPITNDVYGTLHGRRASPRGGRAPGVWITEANLDPTGAAPPGGVITERDRVHLQAKAALRYYTAFASKGVRTIDLFAIKGGNLALVNGGFFDAVRRAGGAYPGDEAGGEMPRAVRRLTASLAGAKRLRRTRPLSLLRVSDRHNHRQFRGDGTRTHPPLYDRDVLAFFPFQLRRGRYVAAVYVMTRNLAKVQRRGALSNPRRYDLRPERFRLRIGGFRSSRVRATAKDPLTGATVRVRVRRLGRGRIELSMPVTDSPRMLQLRERPASRRARHRRGSRRRR